MRKFIIFSIVGLFTIAGAIFMTSPNAQQHERHEIKSGTRCHSCGGSGWAKCFIFGRGYVDSDRPCPVCNGKRINNSTRN